MSDFSMYSRTGKPRPMSQKLLLEAVPIASMNVPGQSTVQLTSPSSNFSLKQRVSTGLYHQAVFKIVGSWASGLTFQLREGSNILTEIDPSATQCVIPSSTGLGGTTYSNAILIENLPLPVSTGYQIFLINSTAGDLTLDIGDGIRIFSVSEPVDITDEMKRR